MTVFFDHTRQLYAEIDSSKDQGHSSMVFYVKKGWTYVEHKKPPPANVVEPIIKAPEYVYYFRDGVSASEYQRILSEEAPAIRFAIAHACGQAIWAGKMCVVVANKRHHLRAFPDPKNRAAADTHGGPLPGTLIDRDVTSPYDWACWSTLRLRAVGQAGHCDGQSLRQGIGHDLRFCWTASHTCSALVAVNPPPI
ncbi:unnamed protein product [Penicillium viridicatum]